MSTSSSSSSDFDDQNTYRFDHLKYSFTDGPFHPSQMTTQEPGSYPFPNTDRYYDEKNTTTTSTTTRPVILSVQNSRKSKILMVNLEELHPI